jgi:hypothetical protein
VTVWRSDDDQESRTGLASEDRPEKSPPPTKSLRRRVRLFAAIGRGAEWAVRPLCSTRRGGVMVDTIGAMAMTLRLTDEETEALRRRAQRESRSMQDVARQAVREYVENHSRAELLDQVLDEELPRYAEALERLGQ